MFNRKDLEAWLAPQKIEGKGPEKVSSVVIDSRQAREGSLFVALSGERTDGHRYIEDVLEKGACAVLVKAEWMAENGSLVDKWADKACFAAVEDTLLGLQDLAKGYRDSFKELTVVGVTGSNGKTTTKEIIYSILSRSGAAVCNQGNLNSDSGLPLSVFNIREHHRYAVLEMGMNRVGEMASLARVARPDLALVTNVGTAHIGMIGSRQGIAEEKKAIFSHFGKKNIAFVNESDPFTEFLSRDLPGKVVKYGPQSLVDYEFVRDEGIYGQTIRLGGRDVRFPLPGKFNVLNALGAVAVARELGFSEEDIVAGLENCGGQFGRAEVVQGETVTLFRDCYNANGDSMAASLELFAGSDKGRRKIAVLGDMGELGEESPAVHRAVLHQAESLSLEGIFLLGEEFAKALEAEVREERNVSVRSFVDFEELQAVLLENIRKNDLILLKGSRTMALERLSEPLLKH
ncbi:MAG: UDP-N-acetylmuramoyl-tripeptide--D-alanyl-D-alanine ligase [Spirochaetales bacterium]|nr:UDP-N-acetylmuramoyl-tripeptide--D-alanyl-D-alanine ligase [Spirochaetales bacterium]